MQRLSTGVEKAMASHSSTLAWKIPWTEEPGRLQPIGVAMSRTRLSDFTFTFHFHTLEKEMATHSSVLPWRIPGTEEPSGLPSMGSHRVGHNWSDLAAAAEAAKSILFWPTCLLLLIYYIISIEAQKIWLEQSGATSRKSRCSWPWLVGSTV